ncbi:phage regulatory protein/antirepressor Ant [Coprococcus phoceensis]|uniref:phage regulatory protein/antirepressor Ant n=1 Tax=Coprococcus phoceensis TaxID=1870993 RepID=UPI003563448B
MNELEQRLDSREVAEMVGKEHKNIIRDIRGYVKELGELKIEPTNFFTESEYTDKSNRKKPCYLVTKKGCEFIAHKLTGVKGTEFTAKYINRFHEMEGIIQEHIPQGKELLALAVLEAQKTIEEKDAQIEEMKPHAILGQAITTANTSILVWDMAKILRQNGVNIGGRRLFEWLRENGYLIKRKGTDWNLPTQRSVEQGLFEIKESVHVDGNGCNKITRTPKITGKGQQYFVNKFLKFETGKEEMRKHGM